MNTLTKHKPAKATDVWFADQKLFVQLEDGREIGIHWETLDEDISIDGLLIP